MNLFYAMTGLGLVIIGIAVVDEIVDSFYEKRYKRAKRAASKPILLDGWNLPRT